MDLKLRHLQECCLSTMCFLHAPSWSIQTIHQAKGSIPVIIELSYQLDSKALYETQFGRNSTIHDSHAKNYACVQNISEKILGLIDEFLSRVEGALYARKMAYLTNGTTLVRPEKPKGKRASSFLFSDEPPEGNLTENQIEKEQAENSTAPPPHPTPIPSPLTQNDDSNGTQMIPSGETSSIAKEREERSAAAAISIILGLGALASSLTSSLYFAARVDNLSQYMKELNDVIDADAKWVTSIQKDIRVVNAKSSLVGIRYDSVYGMLNRLGEVSACVVQRNNIVMQMQTLAAHLDSVFAELICGRMSPKIIDIDTLMKIFCKTNIDDGTVLQKVPISWYSSAKLSLMSVNPKRRTIRILVASPKVERVPRWVKINLHMPETTVEMNGMMYSQSINFDNPVLALPIDVTNEPGFDLRFMNKTVIEKLRVPTTCEMQNLVVACRDLSPLGKREQECLLALTQNETSLFQMCDVTMV